MRTVTKVGCGVAIVSASGAGICNLIVMTPANTHEGFLEPAASVTVVLDIMQARELARELLLAIGDN